MLEQRLSLRRCLERVSIIIANMLCAGSSMGCGLGWRCLQWIQFCCAAKPPGPFATGKFPGKTLLAASADPCTPAWRGIAELCAVVLQGPKHRPGVMAPVWEAGRLHRVGQGLDMGMSWRAANGALHRPCTHQSAGACRHADHEATAPAAGFTPRHYPAPDGTVSFALNDSLYRRSAFSPFFQYLPFLLHISPSPCWHSHSASCSMMCNGGCLDLAPRSLSALWAPHAVSPFRASLSWLERDLGVMQSTWLASHVLSRQAVSSVSCSGTNHDHDQLPHLRLRNAGVPSIVNRPIYAGPESRYCPAGVICIPWKSSPTFPAPLVVHQETCRAACRCGLNGRSMSAWGNAGVACGFSM